MLERLKDWWKGKPHVRRSSKWPGVRSLWLRFNPVCAVCGSKLALEVHHVIPVHVNPELELEGTNLITLCDGKISCHRAFGHLWDWKSWNPAVRLDAAYWHDKIAMRPRREHG